MEKEITALQKILNTAIEFTVNYSFQVLGAIVVLVLGWLIARWVSGQCLALFERKKLDITLSKFLASVISILVLGFAFIIALGKFGITISPFIAALGALAFGASFAIQGPLSNYGAGLSIILSRPFVVGNTISIEGVTGLVKEVKLACTILTDEDGVTITIPNNKIVGKVLHNSNAYKIVEAVVGVSYSDDPETAIQVVKKTLSRLQDVATDPPAQVGIQEFGDSSMNIGYRYWVPTIKYFQTVYAVNLAVYQGLKAANISIPFPQQDLHIVSNAASQNIIGMTK
ncbi:MAG: mechanosensitive ion channel protein MscS [Omnitrophica bacterium RIFCSPLOWO2_12_FULL_44_17]|uniref:Mechanosensitive ion channel protein MscS n=1 Tax=Candidatus Danuiimicrobium aquiferis TaxID=1801832 RepID=A0A1G1L199_9BACT|nr:MAG: mechanosensitive ion channel protein MscS [Omnitrophica bacterium RIFCSPHIGHO2_02_FULL_45_28]OGW91359.1 MAG: mechanosensitive ion channel protein MscS [Omnitrophica bacterium RIFCSPHIGHO2_12_FULL_44_12]OGW98911.1 MAG: mechanosensitive ion channel protein MscS [Omnitrophica bacterium RIFCSPLOWO2_12_FULL_44_17]OGX03221.1 MAG: mechanosensitive ion channel protein MscS [Omnitrophica bacterium RIFCSPLOWO2_02_FULL_44_11]